MSEKTIERAAVAYAKKHNIYTRKFVSPSQRGVPDRIFFYKGHVLFVEFKQARGRISALQQREIDLINAQTPDGEEHACVVWNAGDAYLALRELIRRATVKNHYRVV